MFGYLVLCLVGISMWMALIFWKAKFYNLSIIYAVLGFTFLTYIALLSAAY